MPQAPGAVDAVPVPVQLGPPDSGFSLRWSQRQDSGPDPANPPDPARSSRARGNYPALARWRKSGARGEVADDQLTMHYPSAAISGTALMLRYPREIEMDLQSVCRDVMDDVDGTLGCVLTDLETGLPLAAEYRAGTVMNANTISLVSHVGIDLFRGKLVRNFERSLSRNRRGSGGFVREVQLTTTNTYQFMSSVPGWEQVVFILVTNKNVSLGMGLLAVHDAVRRLSETPRRGYAPATNPTFRPREDASEPSTPPRSQALEQRRAEPQHDGTFDPPEQREATPERSLETLPQPDNGRPPQPERPTASLTRAPATSEAVSTQSPTPDISPKEPAAPPAEPPKAPRAETETPRAAATTAKEPSPGESRYYRGVIVDGPEAEAVKSTPSAAPIGPRARMFFKRSDDEKKKKRRRRS